MDKQIYFEDVDVGMGIPSLVKHPSNVQLMKFCAVGRIFHRVHYDKDYAVKEDGHPNILAHGPLQGAFLIQMVTDWMVPKGRVKKISYQIRASSFPGDTLICKGKVTKKYEKDGEHCIECEAWIEKDTGQVCVPATIIATLPSRSS